MFSPKLFLKEFNSHSTLPDIFAGRNVMWRLYDIVNVFKAFGLIEKQIDANGKSESIWKGINGFLDQLKKFQTKKEKEN